jgi:hypothetical protein
LFGDTGAGGNDVPGWRTIIAGSIFAVALSGCTPGAPVTGGTGGTPTPPTQDAATRSSPVVVGRPARVFIFAGLDKSCKSLPPPEIVVTAPPTKGDLSFRPGQQTTIQYSLSGSCVGSKASGTGLYYTARKGASGTDRFAVDAKLSSGETASRSFEVRITE